MLGKIVLVGLVAAGAVAVTCLVVKFRSKKPSPWPTPFGGSIVVCPACGSDNVIIEECTEDELDAIKMDSDWFASCKSHICMDCNNKSITVPNKPEENTEMTGAD